MIITKTKDANYKELYSDKYFVIYERESAKVSQEEQKSFFKKGIKNKWNKLKKI